MTAPGTQNSLCSSSALRQGRTTETGSSGRHCARAPTRLTRLSVGATPGEARSCLSSGLGQAALAGQLCPPHANTPCPQVPATVLRVPRGPNGPPSWLVLRGGRRGAWPHQHTEGPPAAPPPTRSSTCQLRPWEPRPRSAQAPLLRQHGQTWGTARGRQPTAARRFAFSLRLPPLPQLVPGKCRRSACALLWQLPSLTRPPRPALPRPLPTAHPAGPSSVKSTSSPVSREALLSKHGQPAQGSAFHSSRLADILLGLKSPSLFSTPFVHFREFQGRNKQALTQPPLQKARGPLSMLFS